MTLWTWTHPKKAAKTAARENDRQRARRAATASLAWPGVRGPEWKVARMRALSDAGLTPTAIASVMRLDFPKDPPLFARHVRAALRTNTPPVPLRRAAKRAA